MNLTIPDLAQRMDEIAAQYESRFAGLPRPTRSLPALDRILQRATELLASLDAMPAEKRGEEWASLRDKVAGNLQIYKDERAAIAQAQEGGPDFEEAASLASFANLVFGRYLRHFAGQSRSNRDLLMLEEMVSDLATIEGRMGRIRARTPAALPDGDYKLVKNNLELYRRERKEIQKVQADASQGIDGQAGLLATLANGQMALYQQHFAGRSRATRRPALLERMIRGLKGILTQMRALSMRPGVPDWHAKNIEVVTRNLRLYETELAEVRKVREGMDLVQLVMQLGQEGNEVLEEYNQKFAGRDRKEVDLAGLGVLCDRLEELARQLRDLMRAAPGEEAREAMDVVLSSLISLEGEYNEVMKRQAPAKQEAQ
jgi:hypothetical protein